MNIREYETIIHFNDNATGTRTIQQYNNYDNRNTYGLSIS